MISIAILGYGTVGSGVVEVLEKNRDSINKKAGEDILIKYILDLKDFPGTPIENIVTHNYDDILNDDEVKVIAEVMGGVEPAYTFVRKALEKGKSVVTSNKELVAKHGPELLAIAKEKNINFLFEASVGGGIPIIRPLNQSLTADEIYEITGILNGTTNYILTKMSKEGLAFDTVLKEAQEKGYAERNPEADVEGYDACRKIAILASLAFGMNVNYENIHTEGITKITARDMEYAKALNRDIKLIANCIKEDNKIHAMVAPVMIDNTHPLAHVNDVFNAIFIKGNVIGEVMFYGRGAGKLPTASAVVADIIDAIKHKGCNIMSFWSTKSMKFISMDQVKVKFFVSAKTDFMPAAQDSAEKIFGKIEYVKLDNHEDEIAFTTQEITEKAFAEMIELFKEETSIVNVESSIRLG